MTRQPLTYRSLVLLFVWLAIKRLILENTDGNRQNRLTGLKRSPGQFSGRLGWIRCRNYLKS